MTTYEHNSYQKSTAKILTEHLPTNTQNKIAIDCSSVNTIWKKSLCLVLSRERHI